MAVSDGSLNLAASARLLYGVGDLVGKEVHSAGRFRRVLALSKHDVLADRESLCVERTGGGCGGGAGMNADVAKIVADARLQE